MVVMQSGTNAAGELVSNCNLGNVTLTNHSDTYVSLGNGKNCVLTPNVVDSRDVQLTLTVESKTNQGKVHDLSVAQVVTRSGQEVEVAVGNYNFSLTPNLSSE